MKQKIMHDYQWWSLLMADFFGAFNDNAFKMMVSSYLLLKSATLSWGSLLLSMAAMAFVVPFILLATLAGQTADRFNKKHVIVFVKVSEVVLMLLAVSALYLNSWVFMLVLLFLMGAHSAFYGPAKYGIIPEIVEHAKLSQANGMVQLVTFAAIILGQAIGGMIVSNEGSLKIGAFVFLGVALLGFIASLFVRSVKPREVVEHKNINPIKEIRFNWQLIKQHRGIWLSILGLAFFSFLGALFQLNILVFTKAHLGLDAFGASVLLIVLALGIALGGISAARVSDQHIELGLVPLGSFGLAIMCILLGVNATHLGHVVAILFCLGFCAGFYTVPLNAYIQHHCDPQHRGKILATSSFVSFTAVLIGSGVFYVLSGLFHFAPAVIFIVCGLLTLLGVVIAVKLLPFALCRLIIWTAAHTFYKIRAFDAENIPSKGGALLVANHVSFIDAVLLIGITDRPIRFIMSREMYQWKPIHWLCRIARVIPIVKNDSPKALRQALLTARSAIEEGEIVCIFPEGQLTRTGNTNKFNRGVEFIIKGLSAPIIPIHIDRVWGSVFSFKGGRLFARWPKALPYPVTITVGAPVSSPISAFSLRQIITQLGSQAFKHRLNHHLCLSEQFFRQMRQKPFAEAIADSSGRKLNAFMTFIMAQSLGWKLKERVGCLSQPVGIVLPPSVGGVLVNIALGIESYVAVNINLTSSLQAWQHSIKQANIQTLITTAKIRDKYPLPFKGEVIDVEALIKQVTIGDLIVSFFKAMVLPRHIAARLIFGNTKQRSHQDIATIIFTSGSTGLPKGVLLSHANIQSNIEGLYQLLESVGHDKILGVLPFFHAFGYTATLWFPLITSIGTVYHYNPLDYKTIGSLCRDHGVTMLMSTPTFLEAYRRGCTKEQFKSLRLIVVGAEKLKPEGAQSFYEDFGIMPMEGYGCTELSPIVSVNWPDYKQGTIHQRTFKQGSIGQPLPGVSVKIIDPLTSEEKGYDQPGLLFVKGPNVMQGYLNDPVKTSAVLKDGWYNTGDMATMDEDGIITITGRLSRFSKIAGEMVPHLAVEQAILKVCEDSHMICVVAAISDEKKGERLGVVYVGDIDPERVTTRLRQHGLPNLWVPSVDMYVKVDILPVLSSGKIDLMAIKAMLTRCPV